MFENEVMTAKSGGNFVLTPAGNHVARLCAIIEIGTVDDTVTNKKTNKTVAIHQRKVRLGFEVIGSEHIFSPEKGPEPFVIYKDYNYVMSKGSNLYKDMKSWAAKDFTPEEIEKFNFVALLGKTLGMGSKGMVNVIHSKTEKGNDKAEIASITPVGNDPKTGKPMEVPAGKVAQILFNFNLPFKKEVFNSLPNFIQDRIRVSDEYKKIVGDFIPNDTASVAAKPNEIAAPSGDDDLPF